MIVLLPSGGMGSSKTIHSIRDLAAAVRGRRADLNLSQADLATRAGVSRKWIYEFEAGKPAAEFELILRALDALDLNFELADSREEGRGPGARTTIDLDELIDEHRQQWPTR